MVVAAVYNDTANRKRAALELLASGYFVRDICTELSIKKAKLRQWKDLDLEFRERWNKIMAELGRWVEDERD